MIALDIIGQKVPAVALGPLAVLGVVVGVTPVHQHKSVVNNSTVQVPAKSRFNFRFLKLWAQKLHLALGLAVLSSHSAFRWSKA